MFSSEVYTSRRNQLRKLVKSGVIFFPGNPEVPFNYPANTYGYRQDSNFLYYFGLDHAGFAGVMDLEEGTDILFGNHQEMDDIIWEGNLPSLDELAKHVGANKVLTNAELGAYLQGVIAAGRKVHFVAPYRAELKLMFQDWLGLTPALIKTHSSVELIKAIVSQREIKEPREIVEIEIALETAYRMHTTAMRMAHEGVWEQAIAGTIEGIALAGGGPVSFPVILSMNGQTLHNHDHSHFLKNGRLLIVDAGCETNKHYAADITRTSPVGGKFSQKQAEIYQTVLNANKAVIEACKPGIFYKDMHLLAARTIVNGLKEIGLMKGDTDAAVAAGAHALFFPHGLGHQMGLDVHDLENLGENYVGYDHEVSRASQFGLAFLRMGKRLKPGHVMTDEPGIYFIPALIDQWRAAGTHKDFINFDKAETYKDFGGIRIEDDLLITETGCKVLGRPIPKEIADVESMVANKLV